jgi:cation:H+ antiporter
MLTYVMLAVGFGLLIKGADWLVDGASSLAKRAGISALVIGLTIVAFGTSLPELIVNILSSLRGSTDIAIGNVVGSNTANILLILGIAATIAPLSVTRGTTWREIPLSLIAIIAVWFMASDATLAGRGFSEIDRIDGVILLLFFAIFLAYVWAIAREDTEEQGPAVKTHSALKSGLMILIGLVALMLGGKWVVDGAVALAQLLGMSEAFIGLTIVAVGTSLPELATSAVASYRGQSNIAVGNAVGSNIFNIFWILEFLPLFVRFHFSPR